MDCQYHYDVVFIGTGPVALTTATILKTINKDIRICLLDKRPDPTRNHGLKIRENSVANISALFTEMLQFENKLLDREGITNLCKVFITWKDAFIRTSVIEDTLLVEARNLGIDIKRGKIFDITDAKMEHMLDQDDLSDSAEIRLLKDICKNASVIIGSDGAHSNVRSKVMGNKLLDQQTLQHLIELKYQTDGNAKPRSYKEATKESLICGHIDVESMNNKPSDEKKPVTLHIFTDKQTYDALREQDENGNTKGIFANPYNLSEIKLKAQNDSKILKVYQIFIQHLKSIQDRGGTFYDEKISTLDMTIYRSEKSVELYKGKFVLLVGDANAGMVLEAGFNKGLQEAVLCAKAVNEFFCKKQGNFTVIPQEFVDYDKKTTEIFEAEKAFALRKNIGLNLGITTVASTGALYQTTKTVSGVIDDEIGNTSFIFADWVGSVLNWLTSSSNSKES